MEDKVLNKVVSLLRSSSFGMTITDLVLRSSISRSSIRTVLAKLEGAKRVKFKRIGMAKLYFLSRGK